MESKSMLATVTGGAIVVATTLFYLYEILLTGTREQAVGGTAAITVAAFIAVMIYEDWRDAKRNTRDGDSRRH